MLWKTAKLRGFAIHYKKVNYICLELQYWFHARNVNNFLFDNLPEILN